MAINVTQVITDAGPSDPICLNRHGNPQTSIVVDVGAGATYDIQGTTDQLNRAGITPTWFTLPNGQGLTANVADKIVNTPLEAVRLDLAVNTGPTVFKVQQNT